MYNAFFGLTESPFNLSPDPAFFYRSAQHEEARRGMEHRRAGAHEDQYAEEPRDRRGPARTGRPLAEPVQLDLETLRVKKMEDRYAGTAHVAAGGVESRVALVERHRGSGGVQVGLVQGFGFNEPCGLASTVAHDSHQMIVIGTDENDMAQAANRLMQTGGGQVVVRRSEIIGEVNLPIAGLMSDLMYEIYSE